MLSSYSSLLLGLLFIVGLVAAQIEPTDDVFLGFSGDEIVDEASVVIGLGRPVQNYRLRLVFSPQLYNTSESIGYITLYNSERLRLTSATYETIIPGRVGRDIVELGSVRWMALIDTRPRAWRGGGSTATLDGLLFIGGLSPPTPGNYWRAALVNRLGITWVRNESSLQDLRDEQAPLTGQFIIQELQEDHNDNASSIESLISGIASAEHVRVKGYTEPEQEFHFAIAPDSHLTRVPQDLFDWYFRDKNFYRDSPLDWEPLVLVFGSSGLEITIQGTSILPLTDNQRQEGDDETGDALRSLNAIVTALRTDDVLISTDEKLENSASFAGFNNLKMIPHHTQTQHLGIVLGGHMLWTSTTVEIDYGSALDATTMVRISSHTSGTQLSVGECVIITIAVILYIRWKLGALWIDYVVDRKGFIHHYYFIVDSDTLLWPFLLPLWLGPLTALLYIDNLLTLLPASLERIVLVMFSVAWLIALALSLALLLWKPWLAMRAHWAKTLQRFRDDPSSFVRRWLSQMSNTSHEAKEEGELINSKKKDKHNPDKPHTTAVADEVSRKHPDRLPDDAAHRHNAGVFFWIKPEHLIVRDTMLDIIACLALWMVVAPIDTPVFAMGMTLIVLGLATYASVHHTTVLLYITTWPLLSRHRLTRVWPSKTQWLALALVILATIGSFYLLIQGAFYPMVATTSALYGNSDESIVAVVWLFILATLFIMTQFAHSFLISLFLRRQNAPSSNNTKSHV